MIRSTAYLSCVLHRLLCLLWIASYFPISTAATSSGFRPLFNGRNLDGWVNANCAPETWSVTNGMIHCSGIPTGALRTDRQYENFILELEWRHLRSGGNSGVFLWGSPIAAPGVPFLRGIEVQVLDHGFNIPGKNEWYTTHGDVFPIHGATMEPFGRHNGQRSFPSEERSRPSPEWNHYRIVCTNGVIRLSVNGKEVSGGAKCHYRKGFLALESEGAPVQFKNIQIKELPSTGALHPESAPTDSGLRSIFNGIDLRNWATSASSSQWQVRGERLQFTAPSSNPLPLIYQGKKWRNFEFILDAKLSTASAPELVPLNIAISPDAQGSKPYLVAIRDLQAGKYKRIKLTLQGRKLSLSSEGKEPISFTLPKELTGKRYIGIVGGGTNIEFMNLNARSL